MIVLVLDDKPTADPDDDPRALADADGSGAVEDPPAAPGEVASGDAPDGDTPDVAAPGGDAVDVAADGARVVDDDLDGPDADGHDDGDGPDADKGDDGDDDLDGPDADGLEGRATGEARPGPTPRAVVLSFGMLAAAVLAGVLVVLPAPYAVNGPGPTRDVLSEIDGEPLIQVDGAPTYPSTGELRLTTIVSTGGPGFPAYLLNVMQGWFSSSSVVRPVEDVFPQDVTQEELDESNAGEMVSSQENATVAALTELGFDVPATLVVAGTVEGTDAQGRLEEGDVLTALDGTALHDYQQLVELLDDVTPGATVTLTVTRHAQSLEVPVETGERADGGAQIGVFIDPSFDMPVDVSINIEGIGGPSAGTMFALGIVDLLTPEDEAAGHVIAGTGTIDVLGDVGPIGGIRQKLAGALRDGASWFLAPADNCDEVVGHVPDGLRVVRVETLSDAREAMVAIGADEADDLPTCTADDLPSDG